MNKIFHFAILIQYIFGFFYDLFVVHPVILEALSSGALSPLTWNPYCGKFQFATYWNIVRNLKFHSRGGH